jgi:hypothetical protein
MRLPASLPLGSLLLVVAPELVSSQEWSGTFIRREGAPTLTLTLTQDQSGRVSGELTGAGQLFRIEGLPQAPGIAGRVTAANGSGWFQAAFAGEELQLILYDSGPDGNPNPATAQQFAFSRTAGAAPAPAGPNQAARPAPDAGSIDDGTRLGREWRSHLAGKKATKMSRYSSGLEGGYTSRTDVHLCGNGQFGLRSQGSVSVDVGGAFGGAGGGGEQGGRWRILTQGDLAGIELKYDNGTVERYRLEFREGATYVEGERWLITPSELCGG